MLDNLLSIMTLASHLCLAAFLSYLLVRKYFKIGIAEGFVGFVKRRAILISLVMTSVALLGSLYFSEIQGFEPCHLCWWQRIFIYPQVALFVVAIIKRKKDVFIYTLPLTVMGLLTSVYHNSLLLSQATGACSATGSDCLTQFFVSFGYINIPVMALTTFIVLLVVGMLANK